MNKHFMRIKIIGYFAFENTEQSDRNFILKKQTITKNDVM